MKQTFLIAFMCVVYGVVASPCFAEDAQDIDDVQTPLRLPDLLTEDGIDAVDIDYWIHTKAFRNGEEPWGFENVVHHTIKPVDGQLVFKEETWAFGTSQYHRVVTTAYSAEGDLVSYRLDFSQRGNQTMQIAGKIEDNKIKLTTTRFNEQGKVTAVEPDKSLPLEPYETSVPAQWQPLVFAYHIRNESLGFRFDRTDINRSNASDTNAYENVGTEQVEFEGKPATAHLFVGTRKSKHEGRAPDHPEVQYLVLTSGEAMSIRHTTGQLTFVSRHITAEEAKEKAGLDEEEEADPAP